MEPLWYKQLPASDCKMDSHFEAWSILTIQNMLPVIAYFLAKLK